MRNIWDHCIRELFSHLSLLLLFNIAYVNKQMNVITFITFPCHFLWSEFKVLLWILSRNVKSNCWGLVLWVYSEWILNQNILKSSDCYISSLIWHYILLFFCLIDLGLFLIIEILLRFCIDKFSDELIALLF